MSGPTPETPEVNPQSRQGAAPLVAVAEVIAQSVERIVSSDGYIDRLADAIVRRQQMVTPYPTAIAPAQLDHHAVLVEPQPLSDGTCVVLTTVPLRGCINANVVVLARDFSKIDQPVVEGEELANYTMAIYLEQIPGDLTTRKLFNFQGLGEHAAELQAEFFRQMKSLKHGQSSFLYVNFLNRTAPAPAS